MATQNLTKPDPSMSELRIAPSIMTLKRSPAERLLLAYVCQRAAAADGQCTDGNKELAVALGIHYQTISTLINRLEQARLLRSTTDGDQSNKRILIPVPELLVPYERNAHTIEPGCERITHDAKSAYERNAHTPCSTVSAGDVRRPSPGKPARPPERAVRFCPITNLEITHQAVSHYFITRNSLKLLSWSDRAAFDEVNTRILTAEQLQEPIGVRCVLINKTVRKLAVERGLVSKAV